MDTVCNGGTHLPKCGPHALYAWLLLHPPLCMFQSPPPFASIGPITNICALHLISEKSARSTGDSPTAVRGPPWNVKEGIYQLHEGSMHLVPAHLALGTASNP